MSKCIIKKVKTVFMYVAILFVLSACSSPEGENTEKIAQEGISGIQILQGCEIVDNIDEFENATEDQLYNEETDANPSFYVLNGTDAGEALYANINRDYFIYCDKSTGNSGLVCGKPDCEHNSDECNSFISSSWGMQYYEGYLYTVQTKGGGFALSKISVDGSERENLGELIDMEIVVQRPYGSNTIGWIIHRGYIYYCYSWDSGSTEDTYYLNNSNCIYRKSPEKDSEPECIMALTVLSWVAECQFIGAGSYVYMKVPTADETAGYLYRYNTESGKLEWFKEWGNEISGAAIHNNKIFYSENNRSKQKTNIYCYDTETKEKTLFLEIDGLVGQMRYDNEYIYVTYEDTEEIWKTGIWNWQGDYIAEIPVYMEFDDEGKNIELAGTDEDYIYIRCMVTVNSKEENIYTSSMGAVFTVMEYIDKEDILDGEYEIKEWSEIAK